MENITARCGNSSSMSLRADEKKETSNNSSQNLHSLNMHTVLTNELFFSEHPTNSSTAFCTMHESLCKIMKLQNEMLDRYFQQSKLKIDLNMQIMKRYQLINASIRLDYSSTRATEWAKKENLQEFDEIARGTKGNLCSVSCVAKRYRKADWNAHIVIGHNHIKNIVRQKNHLKSYQAIAYRTMESAGIHVSDTEHFLDKYVDLLATHHR